MLRTLRNPFFALFFLALVGAFVWLTVWFWNAKEESFQRGRSYVGSDPVLSQAISEMDQVVEAAAWADKNLDPLLEEHDKAQAKVKRKRSEFDAALKELRDVVDRMEKKHQEYGKKFGHLTQKPTPIEHPSKVP
jgi:hypothetical protein